MIETNEVLGDIFLSIANNIYTTIGRNHKRSIYVSAFEQKLKNSENDHKIIYEQNVTIPFKFNNTDIGEYTYDFITPGLIIQICTLQDKYEFLEQVELLKNQLKNIKDNFTSDHPYSKLKTAIIINFGKTGKNEEIKKNVEFIRISVCDNNI